MYNTISQTVIIGKKVIFLPSCHSTNDIAADLVRNNMFEEGTVVITNEQTLGKGQRGSQWFSKAGENLTFSVILNTGFIAVQDQFVLSQAMALGIVAYVKSLGLDCKIKWPNDIYIEGKKAGGILIENSITGGQITSSVVGIGLNINQLNFEGIRATSVAILLDSRLSLPEEFVKLMGFLDDSYTKLQAGNFAEIRYNYLDNLYGLNEQRAFLLPSGAVYGMVSGISEGGLLRLLINGEDTPRELDIKEVIWLWED